MQGETSCPAEIGLRVGDARSTGEVLAAASAALHGQDNLQPFLTATITSPPYANLIDYSTEEQIGFGQSWSAYVADCEKLFSSIYEWTTERGVLWIVADSFVDRDGYVQQVPRGNPTPLRMLPFDLAEIAGRAGWTLREVVIWRKDRTLPWSGRGRMRNSFEYVLFLVKSAKYKYYINRLRDQTDLSRWWVRYPERYSPSGIAPDNVWEIPIPVQGSWRRDAIRHECPFPPDLVRRMLLLSTDRHDWIFDPFAGSGTTVAVAEALGRRAIGIELNSTYVEEYQRSLRPYVLNKWSQVDDLGDPRDIARTIWHLRAIKMLKVAVLRLRDSKLELPLPSVGAVLVDLSLTDFKSIRSINADMLFLVKDGSPSVRKELSVALKDVMQRPPLSKFGVSGAVYVVDEDEFVRLTSEYQFYLYEHGHTWASSGSIANENICGLKASNRAGKHMPIVANVELSVRFPEND